MGDIVTFDHENYARGEIPTNPKISRIRKDLVWNDVLRDYADRKKSSTLLPSLLYFPSPSSLSSGAKRVFADKPRKLWKMRNDRKIRSFFENFAKKRGLDPRLPATWYSLSRRDFEGTMVLLSPASLL